MKSGESKMMSVKRLQCVIRTRMLCVLPAVVMACVFSACNNSSMTANAQSGDAVKLSKEWNEPKSVGTPINSISWEDAPSISPDGTVLYFTRGRDREVYTYVSKKAGETWGEPQSLDEINLKSFPTGAAHTQDGKNLYFSSIRPGGVGEADLYITENADGKWKNLKNVGKPINTKAMEAEPFISPDGNTLYFASNRSGGKGDGDIWMSEKDAGEWGKPVNIGAPVNSGKVETQPFVTSDGKELYFMALNRNGVPGPAIFKSVKQGQAWGKPTLVASGFVGEPTLTADGKYLYFVHIIRKGSKLLDAEIMYATRKSDNSGN